MTMKAEKKRTVRDVLLICVLLALGIGLWLLPNEAGVQAELRIDGKLYGTYALDTDRRIEIIDGNKFLGFAVINNGKIYMESAECKGGDCVRQGGISRKGQCILCLPQGIGIYIVGEGELDGVTG